jgi:hypothetical protein
MRPIYHGYRQPILNLLPLYSYGNKDLAYVRALYRSKVENIYTYLVHRFIFKKGGI